MRDIPLEEYVDFIVHNPYENLDLAHGVVGMTTPRVQQLLNRVVAYEKGWRHLEVGSHKGATFIAAMQNNEWAKGVAYEDYSQFVEEGLRGTLRLNLERFRPLMGEFELREEDFFNACVEGGFNSFFYDGDHSMGSHFLAATAAFDVCSDPFVYIVDDWGWLEVKEGTWQAMAKGSIREMRHWSLSEDERYHNGLGVFVVRKQS